jgi:hypothetical protein
MNDHQNPPLTAEATSDWQSSPKMVASQEAIPIVLSD